MKFKRITLDKLYETKKGIEFMINTMEEAMDLDPQNFEETVCKRYIEIQNVSKLAEELNEQGYRISRRKYIGKNISQIIRDTNESELGKLSNILFKYNNVLQNGSTSFEMAMKNFKEVGNAK